VLGQKRLWDEEAPYAVTPDATTLALFLGGGALVVVSALVLGVASWGRDDEPWPAAASGPATSVSAWRWLAPWRAAGLALAVPLGLLAFLLNDNNTFTPAGSFCWIGAMAVLLVAFWEWRSPLLPRLRWPWGRDREPAPRSLARMAAAFWPFFAVAAVTGLGAFFRLYDLNGVPSAMVSDHVEQLLDVDYILKGNFPVFFPRLEGREGLLLYTTAGLAKFTPLGMDFLSMKFASVLADILAIPVTYLMVRAALGNRWVGLFASFFMAVSHWAVISSRFAMTFGFMPLFVAASLFFLFKALRHNERNSFLLLGLALGLGMYSYRAFRLIPLVVAVVVTVELAAALVSTRRVKWPLLGNALLSALTALIVLAPLGRYALDEPDNYWRRFSSLSGSGEGDLVPTLAGNVKNGLLMFNWVGDSSWWFNFPVRPAFDYVAGALLVSGLAMLAVRWWRKREAAPLYLVLFLFVLLLPSIMILRYPEQNPSFTRTSGAIPIAVVLPALGLHALGGGLRRAIPGLAGAAASILAVGAVAATVSLLSFGTYFSDYKDLYVSRILNSSEIADVISDFGRENDGLDNTYLRSAPYWVDTRAVALEVGDLAWGDTNVVYELKQAVPHLSKPGPLLYVMHADDKEFLNWLRRHYPRGEARDIMPPSGRRFMTFVTEPAGGG
jgi:hypothetical protein